MKNLMTVILSLSYTTSAFADVVWAKTKFWQTPYYSVVKAESLPSTVEVVEKCRTFHKLTHDEAGRVTLDNASIMDSLRRIPLDSNLMRVRGFQADIPTSLPLNGWVMKDYERAELNKLIVEKVKKDFLPGYTQRVEDLQIYHDAFTPFKIKFFNGSYSKISQDLGLSLDPILLVKKSDGLYLRVTSLDLACDIIKKQIHLSATTAGFVHIYHEEMPKLLQFYDVVEKNYSEAVKKSKSYRSRAAIFGLKMGNHLSKLNGNDQELTETHITNLMDFLFVDNNFKLSPVWELAFGEYVLSMSPGTQLPKITVEIQ